MSATIPPGLPKAANAEPCIMCRNLDPETLPTGLAYCWRWFWWQTPTSVVVDCSGFQDADGQQPSGKLHFEKPRRA